MTTGTDYALAAIVCYGLGDFIFKRSVAKGVKPLHFLYDYAWFVGFGVSFVVYLALVKRP